MRRAVASAASDASHAELSSSSATSAGSTTTSARASSPSSRSSGLVNAACAGPRRPSTTTSSTDAARNASSAWSAVSVGASSSRSSTSIRATSIATLPLPTTTARRAERSKVWSAKWGWPLYQATNSVAACEPGQVLARDPEPVVARRAHRVDDGVVALEQVGPLHVGAELDPSEEAQPRVRRGLLEDARDALDLRVVGGDARAHEAERRRQRVEQVDLEALARAAAGRRRSRPGRRRRSHSARLS